MYFYVYNNSFKYTVAAFILYQVLQFYIGTVSVCKYKNGEGVATGWSPTQTYIRTYTGDSRRLPSHFVERKETPNGLERGKFFIIIAKQTEPFESDSLRNYTKEIHPFSLTLNKHLQYTIFEYMYACTVYSPLPFLRSESEMKILQTIVCFPLQSESHCFYSGLMTM